MRRLLPWSRSSVCCKLAKQGETLLFCFVRFFARLGFDEGAATSFFAAMRDYRSVFRADGIARRSFVMLKGKERCVALSDIEDSLNRISAQLTQIEKSLPPRHAWKRRFVLYLASGMARGIGFSIGFTVLGALLLYVLQHIALANLSIIGKFLAFALWRAICNQGFYEQSSVFYMERRFARRRSGHQACRAPHAGGRTFFSLSAPF